MYLLISSHEPIKTLIITGSRNEYGLDGAGEGLCVIVFLTLFGLDWGLVRLQPLAVYSLDHCCRCPLDCLTIASYTHFHTHKNTHTHLHQWLKTALDKDVLLGLILWWFISNFDVCVLACAFMCFLQDGSGGFGWVLCILASISANSHIWGHPWYGQTR